MIEVRDLRFAFRRREVLRCVSFAVPDGTVCFVLGANGAGKTTLFRCLLGLLPISGGQVLLDGEDAKRLSQQQLAARMAYIPQNHAPVFDFSVLDMVLMGTSRSLRLLGTPGQKQLSMAREALARVGAEKLENRVYRQLSGGEQQLVLIARALAQNAKLLLMDEPTANLDYGNQQRVLQCVRDLSREGYAILLSSHDPQHALWYAHSVLALDQGVVEAYGEPETTLTSERIRKLYHIETTFTNGMIIPKREA